MKLTSKQSQVYDLLLMPIICDKSSPIIFIEDNKIISGQKYLGFADEDMSDFTLGFYEIIYKNILEDSRILDDDGACYNIDFSGDTMNSFNSIANTVEEAGNSVKTRNVFSQWPAFLQEYYLHYHCLANFWMVPARIGRQSKKLNYYDSVDIFLNQLEKDYEIMSCYTDYISKVPDFDTFLRLHFVNTGRKDILSLYENKSGEKLVKHVVDDIHDRAYKIATSPYANELWQYFNMLHLVVTV